MAKRKRKKPKPDRQLLDPRLADGIRAMLETGFEADEVARRAVRMVIQIAGGKYASIIYSQHRRSKLSPVLTLERLRAEQEKLEACWGGKPVEGKVKRSLAAMARAAEDDE